MLFPSHFPRPTTQIVPNLQLNTQQRTLYTLKKNILIYFQSVLIDFIHY